MDTPQGKPTAGELHHKVSADQTKYDHTETAHFMVSELQEQVEECIRRHIGKFEEPVFFVVMLLGDDNVLPTAIRRKFYATPFLPEPRPFQTVWAYRRKSGTVDLIWTLPGPKTMAELSTFISPPKDLKPSKQFCDAFFSGQFMQFIREQYQEPDWLTEKEYLERNRSELSKAFADKRGTLTADARDAIKLNATKVDHTSVAMPDQNPGDRGG